MIKTVFLKASYGRLSDRSKFVFADGEALTLHFEGIKPTCDLLIYVNGGDPIAHRGYAFQVPMPYLTPGILHIDIQHVVEAQTVRTWHVEPIVISAADKGYEGHPEFDELKKKVDVLTLFYKRLKRLGGNNAKN